jgi:hypothetical protein
MSEAKDIEYAPTYLKSRMRSEMYIGWCSLALLPSGAGAEEEATSQDLFMDLNYPRVWPPILNYDHDPAGQEHAPLPVEVRRDRSYSRRQETSPGLQAFCS